MKGKKQKRYFCDWFWKNFMIPESPVVIGGKRMSLTRDELTKARKKRKTCLVLIGVVFTIVSLTIWLTYCAQYARYDADAYEKMEKFIEISVKNKMATDIFEENAYEYEKKYGNDKYELICSKNDGILGTIEITTIVSEDYQILEQRRNINDETQYSLFLTIYTLIPIGIAVVSEVILYILTFFIMGIISEFSEIRKKGDIQKSR